VCSALPSLNDPIRKWKRRQRWIIAVGAIISLGVSAWAMWPYNNALAIGGVDAARLIAPQPEHVEDAATVPKYALTSATVFASVRLWDPPPLSSAATSATLAENAEDIGPPTLQLIGIVRQGGRGDGGGEGGGDGDGVLYAALYDIEQDRLLILRSGDRIGRYTITTISEKVVELTDGRRTTRLALQPEVPPT